MKTPLYILQLFYKILNITELTDIIDGEIFTNKKPSNRELQDIVINSLPLKSGYLTNIQNGTVNINCYCKDLNNRPDTLKLMEISDKTIEILEKYKQGITELNFDIVNIDLITEYQQNTMSFVNIKLNIHNN